MKCRSVACIWTGTPLSHRVTATAVLNHPPTLYTGGSDGSIIWWNLSLSDSSSEIEPVAVLCGHAATIVDLGICYPLISGTSETEISSDAEVNSTSEICGALVSVCSDGVLCIWSRRSGHCRHRRKLPAWVGSPSMVRTIPSKPRYVCIGCCFIDSAHSSDHHSVDHAERSEASTNKEYRHRNHSKCSFVTFDTYTLSIVQTVVHGNLSIGSLRYMAIVSPLTGEGNHSAVLVDSFGRLQMVSTSNYQDKVDEASLHNSSQVDISIWDEVLSERGLVLSVATKRNIIAFLLPDRCVFKLLINGLMVGELSFTDILFGVNEVTSQTHAAGAMFLEGGDELNNMDSQTCPETFVENFAVWNSGGHAIVYMISFANNVFEYKLLYEIPASFNSSDARLAISFIQLNKHVIRVESLSSQIEEPYHWTSSITIWSLQEKHHVQGNSYLKCKMVGESSSLAEWISDSTCYSEFVGQYGVGSELNSQRLSDSSSGSVNDLYLGGGNNFVQKGQIISSSMVISDSLSTPYAVVYGYFSGDIQILKLDLFQDLPSHSGSPHCEVNHHVPQLYLSGHMGPVLCLAVHRIVGKGNEQVLLSGSMDCTIRIWDLESGKLIMVMHHHVAPVRQIILPPSHTDHPWSNCFLSVGEDSCVALASLETLKVERMFPGHRNYPEKVVWDGVRGYIACMCSNHSSTSDTVDILYIWDIKTGARERIIPGEASHSVFDYFCKGVGKCLSGSVLNGNTSASSLFYTIVEDGSINDSVSSYGQSTDTLEAMAHLTNKVESGMSNGHARRQNSAQSFLNSLYNSESEQHPIKCSCPFPGIATISFDLTALMSFNQKAKSMINRNNIEDTAVPKDQQARMSSPNARDNKMDDPLAHEISTEYSEELNWISSYEECLIRFSLSFLHVWGVDSDLDNLLVTDMKLKKPESFIVASGLQGDKGSLTVTFRGLKAVLELWKSSAEFCAIRSLMILSLAQHMISLFHSGSSASSALAAFYMRNFVDKVPDIKPPLLQLLVSFWQDESEHVRMAARSLFHCAASRAIPLPLRGRRSTEHGGLSEIGDSDNELDCLNVDEKSDNVISSACIPKSEGVSQVEEFIVRNWLESYEIQDWISCVGGKSQDAMTSHLIVAAALSIWYRSLVKKILPMLVVHSLVKLVKSMNDKYSSTAAELLAEGMDSTWKACLGNEIPHLIEDVLLQLEYVSGPSANQLVQNSALPVGIRETLVEVLLPNLAMADIPGFLTIIESQIWSTASDSPVHLLSLKTLIRVVRGCPRNLAPYLDKAVNFILQIMDPSNSVLRKICYQSSMAALKEVVHVFPMVSLNDSWTRLAVGDVIGEINSASIRVYDLQSVTKIKVLDASGPPGLPSLLAAGSEKAVRTSISALSFSPDGEGVVAFSEHGLMIRWWSVGSVWWEKLSRNFVPVQCTKVIFVSPWEGFSPNSSRLSIMASATDSSDRQADVKDNARDLSHADILKILIHSLDLSYRLEWTGERKLQLTRHGNELGTFQI
ncbi:uncharacterized protein LOC111478602 isoform X1 [Cucurbita maxima]|uniref:Uncharacterized protein LOC111478602 isoform X1 n=1 Tax=Cucurbita maxima TaxID=3661 RepID=A0A6J1IR27_CUCMA|nr:uncharacterized protein LOC111478602 isoform X1 [Cucurbita maxima]